MNYIKMPAGLLAMFATAAMLTGCFNTDNPPPADNPKDGLTLNIAVPGMTALTRSWEENRIDTVNVIVFDGGGFIGNYMGTKIHSNTALSTYQYFISGLELTGDFEVVVVANYPAVVTKAVENAAAETSGGNFTKEQFVKHLEFTAKTPNQPLWYPTTYPIPMYGETWWEGAFSSATQAVSVELTRAIAYLEVQMLDSYRMEWLSFRNLYYSGMLRPNYENPLEPNLPISPLNIGPASVNEISNYHIYIMEAPTPEMNTDKGFYILVKLKYGGVEENYYRINMAWDGSIPGTVRGEPMPILRNYKYYVTINKVLGPGYSSQELAKNGEGELNNLDYTIHVEEQGRFEKVAYDGRYMLGVGKTSFDVSADEQVVKFLVSSNHPSYWTADATDSGWLELAFGNTNASTRWDKKITSTAPTNLLSVKVGKNATGGTRSTNFHITSGKLSIPITIRQSAQSTVSLEIIGYDQPPGMAYLFLWDRTTDTKGIMIKWTPADAEVKVSLDYGGFIYGEDSDRLEDNKSLWGGTAIFNIYPAQRYSGSTYQSQYTFKLVSNGVTLTKSLSLVYISRGVS